MKTGSRSCDRFAGLTALITGGGSGIGRAAALRLAREGANVVVAGRRIGELHAVVDEIRRHAGSALAVRTDVTNADDVSALVARTLTTFGALHLAWNNAGTLGAFDYVQDVDIAAFDTVIATNLRGVFACLKYEIAAMRELGIAGAIVNTSSWTAHGAMPGTAPYAASKGGIDAMMRAVALEAGPCGIRVNNVSPGIIATPMSHAALGDADSAAMRPFRHHTPLQRIGSADEVAAAALWLLSDDARFVTGQCVEIDGGFTIGGLRAWMQSTAEAR